MPPALMVDRLMPSTHASVGGLAGGGGGGGGGVGAVGVELQAAASVMMTTAEPNPERTAQYFTKPINMN
jgi:hypothetical protein